MNSERLFVCAAVLSAALSSCIEDVEFNGEEKAPVPVMYSIVSAGDTVAVDLSASVFFLHDGYTYNGGYSDEFFTPLDGKAISVRAYVNGSKSSVGFSLASKPVADDSVKWETSEVSYRYVSDYVANPGDHIEFEVDIEGFDHLSSEADVPCNPVFTVEKVDSVDCTTRRIRLTVEDNPDEANYYTFSGTAVVSYSYFDYEADTTVTDTSQTYCYINVVSGNPQSSSSLVDLSSSYISDEMFNGRSHVFELEVDCRWGDPISADLYVYCLSQPLYNYWYSRELQDSFYSFIGESVHVYSNVEGGIGCTAGQVVKCLKCI